MGAKRSESIVTWLIIGAQQIHAPHPTKGVHRNKFRRGQICANRQILGGGQYLNCKFKTFSSLETYTYSPITLQVLLVLLDLSFNQN